MGGISAVAKRKGSFWSEIGNRQRKQRPYRHGFRAKMQFFLTNCPFLKIYPPQSGYRKLRRRNSLRQISFSGLYDASLARNNEISVFDLDLGWKKLHPVSVNAIGRAKCFAKFFDKLAVFEDLPPPKVGIGSSVVEIHCARYLFQVCTMLHWRETTRLVFSISIWGEKRLHLVGLSGSIMIKRHWS